MVNMKNKNMKNKKLNMKNMKAVRIIRVMRVILVVLFIIAMYFLLPYILNILSVKSFVFISGSMRHLRENQALFESFWREKGIEPTDLPFRHGINTGDLMILDSSQNQTYSVGEVVIFKTPTVGTRTTHRIYKYNSTHFRDVWDWCITEENLETTLLSVKGSTVNEISDFQSVSDPDSIYEAPKFEKCSFYWMPVSLIEGKPFLVLPWAGLLYNKLNPRMRGLD